MLQHLRLARARGSLSAPNSRVQDEALNILMALDDRGSEKSRLDMVKAVLSTVVAPYDRVREYFPEFFPPRDPFAEAVDETGEVDIDKIDDSAVDWAVPASPEDDEEISRFIREAETASLTAADITDDFF